jgi:spermidine synthase
MPCPFLLEEIAHAPTSMGELVLRRRTLPQTGDLIIHEVKLGEEFLMSSLFTAAEIALARLGLEMTRGEGLEVVVGGLGLGYTAHAALEDVRVSTLLVVDALQPVIDWHRAGLVPLGTELTADSRCRLIHEDFFALAAEPERGFDPDQPGRRFDAVLLDVDHTPDHLLHARHGGFYTEAGLRVFARNLKPGGVFALWSNELPEPGFLARMRAVFTDVRAEIIRFPNPLQAREASNSVYLGRT